MHEYRPERSGREGENKGEKESQFEDSNERKTRLIKRQDLKIYMMNLYDRLFIIKELQK